MTAMDAAERTLELLEDLRPQAYAVVSPDRVDNPVIEPLWAGVRVLAAVEGGEVDIRDEDGAVFSERPQIAAALVAAARATSLILDGYLTKQTADATLERMVMAEIPSASALLSKPLLGIRRDRTKEAEEERERLREATTFRDEEPVSLVATDLLWLDDQSLLDVPLLERKRLLDAVLAQSELVRVGAFVRPPIATWVSSWRRLGFYGITYRGANSRYHPGEERDEWTTAPMPRR
jgi:ATP-dependent DNA ligase